MVFELIRHLAGLSCFPVQTLFLQQPQTHVDNILKASCHAQRRYIAMHWFRQRHQSCALCNAGRRWHQQEPGDGTQHSAASRATEARRERPRWQRRRPSPPAAADGTGSGFSSEAGGGEELRGERAWGGRAVPRPFPEQVARQRHRKMRAAWLLQAALWGLLLAPVRGCAARSAGGAGARLPGGAWVGPGPAASGGPGECAVVARQWVAMGLAESAVVCPSLLAEGLPLVRAVPGSCSLEEPSLGPAGVCAAAECHRGALPLNRAQVVPARPRGLASLPPPSACPSPVYPWGAGRTRARVTPWVSITNQSAGCLRS